MDLLMSKLETLQEKLNQMEQNQEKNENARQKSVLGAEASTKTLENFLVARDIGFLRGKLDEMERSTMAREDSFRVKLEEMERSIRARDDKLNCLEQKLQDIERNQSTKEFRHQTNLDAAESSTKEPWDHLRSMSASIEQAITVKTDYLRGKLEGIDHLLEENESKSQEKLVNFETTMKAMHEALLKMERDMKAGSDIRQDPAKDEYLRDKLNEMDRLLKERESKLQEKLVYVETTTNATHEALLKMDRDITAKNEMLCDILDKYKNHMEARENALEEELKSIKTIENPSETTPTSNGPYKSCEEIPPWKSGIYEIEIAPNENISVYCDQIRSGGGWIVIQQRFSGEVNFNRGWVDYRYGFGNLSGEFWLGLEHMHRLTATEKYELFVECEDMEENRISVRYSDVKIDSRKKGYTLNFEFGYLGESYHNDLLHFEAARGCRFNVSDCKGQPNGGWWGSPFSMGSLNGCYGTAPNSTDERKHLLMGFRDVTFSRMSIRARTENIVKVEDSEN